MGISALNQPNILILISDETRYPQHWPADFVPTKLQTWQNLMSNGLTFTNAITAACECSPSRASFVTSTYPEENGVKVTFTNPLPTSATLANLATVLAAANPSYPVIWKGKWHLSFPSNPSKGWQESDIATLQTNYSMQQWNPPDAGTTLSPDSTLGGGTPDNDGRFVNGVTATGQTQGFGESVIDFISNYDASTSGPFCMVVSLVNPHDVFLYPGPTEQPPTPWLTQAGYSDDVLNDIGIKLPHNHHDDLSTKPSAQKQFREWFDEQFKLGDKQARLNYVNFYAYLHTLSDQLFGDVMTALEKYGLTNSTLVIRMADHGEMAMSHGLREKMYNAYEEAIHVPLVFSNPIAWPEAQTTHSMASLLDLVPTLAEIVGSPHTTGLRGKSLYKILDDPTHDVHHDGVVYTYDDSFHLPPTASGTIRCLRTKRWKYAVYFSETPSAPNFEYEMYDLEHDRGELTNLLYGTPTGSTLEQWQTMHGHLTNKLNELGAMPTAVTWPTTPWETT